MTSTPPKSFFLDGHVVGAFEEYPASPGIYAYMPFRGIGHLRMVEQRKQGRFPRCSFKRGATEVSFEVAEVASPRKLRIDHIETRDDLGKSMFH